MPTATSLSGYSLINIGPLTTTFTAPASCSTPWNIVLRSSSYPSLYQWNVDCHATPPADCDRSGSAAQVQSLVSAAQGDNPKTQAFIVYHSPGLVCPSGWSTVGAATKVSSTSVSISGAFNVSVDRIGDDIGSEPGLDVVLAALDPGETAAVCCPSGYTTMWGGCYSDLPTYTATGGCQRQILGIDVGSVNGTWTWGEQTVTGEVFTVTGTLPITTQVTTFAASEATDYIAGAMTGIVLLVHQASDTAAASTAKQTGASSSSDSKPNAAPSLKTTLQFTAKMCFLSLALGLCMGI